MRILIWGLGTPGLVSAASLAQFGHSVTGIDINEAKVAAINSGLSSCHEPGLASIVQENIQSGSLQISVEIDGSAKDADLSIICVGTPPTCTGGLDTSQIESVVETLALELRESTRIHRVILRSTVSPGCTREVLAPRLEKTSGRKIGRDLALAVCPEFLREGNALEDFHDAAFVALGTIEDRSPEMLSEFAQSLPGEVVHMSAEEAEMLKLMNNSFHALKIGFANEVACLCSALQLDANKLMALVCRDTRLNISSAYLAPGFSFGGPCLPKDVSATTAQAIACGLRLPILESILPSNEHHFDACLRAIRATGLRSVGILGLAFKSKSDDLRNSPALRLCAQLFSEGFALCAYDPEFESGEISHPNLRVLNQTLPEYRRILRPNLEAVLNECTLLVITRRNAKFHFTRTMLENHRLAVLDLTNGDLACIRASTIENRNSSAGA